jgi:hypothetical protein
VNGDTYRHKKKAGLVVGCSIREKGNEAVTQRKHTLVLGHCRVVGQSICEKGTRQSLRGKPSDSIYGCHSNKTHIREKKQIDPS